MIRLRVNYHTINYHKVGTYYCISEAHFLFKELTYYKITVFKLVTFNVGTSSPSNSSEYVSIYALQFFFLLKKNNQFNPQPIGLINKKIISIVQILNRLFKIVCIILK